MLSWIVFAACALVIAIAGTVLTRSADAIAEITHLSRSRIGLVLLATATSLPELFTGVSAVAVADAPNIAVGDALGSCIFNLALLALLDMLSRDDPLYARVERGHILTATLGVIMIGFVGAQLIVARGDLDIRILHISIYTPILILVYVVSVRAAFRHARAGAGVTAVEQGTDRPAALLRPVLMRYLLSASAVIVAGSALPFAGLAIAEEMGWHTSFVGTIFVAAATSLPELVVTVVAVRLRAVDMAVANLLGSNLFDMLILGLDDIAYAPGSLLATASPAHAGSAFAATIMSGVVILAVLDRPCYRVFGKLGWTSILLLLIFILSSYAMFLHGA